MIADILYPIFTLTITVLSCFKQKKSFAGGLAEYRPGSPRVAYSTNRPPTAISLGFAKNKCAHLFSVLFPDICQYCKRIKS